ncbi:MAG: hypothetical protein GY904_15560 [Planctomycetaceae bacterium]|nr:hypothetical protein [Planctomycetaceae bacterium]
MLKQYAIRTGAVVAACTATLLVSTGCRSMPGAGLFASRGPSADALAGNGPTTTYPVPPSHGATPESLASIAGGTAAPAGSTAAESATAQVAGIEISPGYALAAGADPATAGPNMAAAEANGVYSLSNNTAGSPPSFAASPAPNSMGVPNSMGAPNSMGVPAGMTVPPGMGTPSDATAAVASDMPSGYTFGNKALTPKTTQPGMTTGIPASSPSHFAPPSGPLTPPSTGVAALPPSGYSQPPSSSGFALPSDPAAMAGMMPPATPPNPAPAMTAATPVPSQYPTGPSITVPVGNASPADNTAPSFAPSFSTAQAPESTAPSTSNSYMPGSTGTGAGYPTNDAIPTTSGSFYR